MGALLGPSWDPLKALRAPSPGTEKALRMLQEGPTMSPPAVNDEGKDLTSKELP